VRVLANPVLLRAGVVFCCATFAFLLGLICMRLLRKSIADEADISSEAGPASLDTLPLHVYNTVIQQLKQQKYELLVQSQAEQNRARTTETLSQAVLSNLSCGVLVFGTNGLVKSSNPAAKEILGFASTTGMSAGDIFRGATVGHGNAHAADAMDELIFLTEEVEAVLREGSGRRQVHAEYETPTGQPRYIAVTIFPVPAIDGSLLGVTCLMNDLSEMEGIRRQQAMQWAISAEMALELRTSLTTISGYAQQFAEARDPGSAKQLAADIAQEAADLDRKIGGFLTTKGVAHGALAGTAD
jgi:nitrogen fixation/metabolism regulation signal transduction histidine kinase